MTVEETPGMARPRDSPPRRGRGRRGRAVGAPLRIQRRLRPATPGGQGGTRTGIVHGQGPARRRLLRLGPPAGRGGAVRRDADPTADAPATGRRGRVHRRSGNRRPPDGAPGRRVHLAAARRDDPQAGDGNQRAQPLPEPVDRRRGNGARGRPDGRRKHGAGMKLSRAAADTGRPTARRCTASRATKPNRAACSWAGEWRRDAGAVDHPRIRLGSSVAESPRSDHYDQSGRNDHLRRPLTHWPVRLRLSDHSASDVATRNRTRTSPDRSASRNRLRSVPRPGPRI